MNDAWNMQTLRRQLMHAGNFPSKLFIYIQTTGKVFPQKMFQNQSEAVRGLQTLQDFDAGSACRICLSSKGQCGLFWMNSKLKQLLAQMFSIMVDREGSWKICVPCLQAIERAAEFREMAAKSDRLIQQIVKRSATSPQYDEEDNASSDSYFKIYEETSPTPQETYYEEKEDLLPEFITVTSKQPPKPKPKIIFKSEVSPRPSTSTEREDAIEIIEELEPETFKCSLCPSREFQTKRALVKHRRIKHKPKAEAREKVVKPKLVNGKWICCGEEHTAEGYEMHKQEYHPRTYGCLICLVKFTNRSELMRHQKENHKDAAKSTFCLVCCKDFPTVGTLRSHISRMHKMSMETMED